MQKTSKNKSTPKLAIHPRLKKSRYSRIFKINPNWNLLFDINIWIVAFSQIIFSLGIGEALALTYATYLSNNENLTDNVFFVVASNSSFEIFTAFGVFSILGYMSASSGTPLVQLVSEGTGLIFVVFPKIFTIMGTMGRILAPLFFLAVLFAGISSAFAFFEPIIGSISSKTSMSRKKTRDNIKHYRLFVFPAVYLWNKQLSGWNCRRIH